MCGRYQFDSEEDLDEINRIIEEINDRTKGKSVKTGEVCPTDAAPVLIFQQGRAAATLMNWGFPKWDGKGVIINAKSETTKDKNLFKTALWSKRCVIPSTGFFEWQKKDERKAKDKFLFTCKESPVLYMAGIYNAYRTGEELRDCFVIFTRSANRFMEDIHDRMPVILYQNEIQDWLNEPRFVEALFQRDSVILERKQILASSFVQLEITG